jgi:hypothetical protein
MFFFPTEKYLVTFDKRSDFESCADILIFALFIQMLMVYKRIKGFTLFGTFRNRNPTFDSCHFDMHIVILTINLNCLKLRYSKNPT